MGKIKKSGIVVAGAVAAILGISMGSSESTYADATCNASAKTIAEALCLQDFNQDVINSMTTSAEYSMIDYRDGSTYKVARLLDGRVWMLDNLALDLTDTSVKANLTNSTTNATDTELNYLKNGGGSATDKYATNGVAKWTSGYSYSSPLIDVTYKGNNATYPEGYTGPIGKIGAYYNYCAASAGTYCYDSDSPSVDATADICPKNWRMPTGGNNGEYQSLYEAYGDNSANFQNATRVTLSGIFYDGSADKQGMHGYFWSSSRYDGLDTYGLYFSSLTIDPVSNNRRNDGYSVRCVSKLAKSQSTEPTEPTNPTDFDRLVAGGLTLQELGTMSAERREALLAEMVVGTSYNVADVRDDNAYEIAKLADGKVWLRENLRLNLADANVKAVLSSENTNALNTVLGFLKNGGGSSPFAVNGVVDTTVFDQIMGQDDPGYVSAMINTSLADTMISAEAGVKNGHSYEWLDGKIGVYYNYCAASAGSICYSGRPGEVARDAQYDICPVGWSMPKMADYEYLLKDGYADNPKDFMTALRALPTGEYMGNAVFAGSIGGFGRFWSSNAIASNQQMGSLPVYYSVDSAGNQSFQVWDNHGYNYNNRREGLSVRCILNGIVNSDDGIGAPDTGAFIAENGGGIIATISVVAIGTLSGIAYVALRNSEGKSRVKIK